MNKNPFIAFILAVIPGVGHFYLNKIVRGILYFLGFFGSLFVAILIFNSEHMGGEIVPFIFFSFLVWMIDMIDMILTLIRRHNQITSAEDQEGEQKIKAEQQNLIAIFLSFVPGLGHLQLGLMNRGLTFIVAFFGMITMIFFVTVVSHQSGFLVFICLLPIIWIYSFFDVFQQLNRKNRGENLVDQTFIEDFDQHHEDGKKNKPLAILLSIFPGAGHLYLGLQKRGIQLMAGFLFSIYILDILRISAFFFLIPLIWFYSFFDALQKVSKQGEEAIEDIPIISYFTIQKKWVGIVLIIIGVYYIVDSIVIPIFNISYLFHQAAQTAIVCLLLIGGGIKLLLGNKKKQEDQSQLEK